MIPVSEAEWLGGEGGAYRIRVQGGDFSILLEREEVRLPDLLDFALRNNGQRRFLFVSRVLGRHWPVRPAALRDVAGKLAGKLRHRLANVPTVFVGMAETATTLAQAVFEEWLVLGGEGLYIESTRRRTGGPVAFGFAEAHSHATAHVIHEPGVAHDPGNLLRSARQVVIVDDEATTTRTACALGKAFRAWRGEAGVAFDAFLAVLVRWKSGMEEPANELAGIECLAEGTFQFAASGHFPDPPTEQHDIQVQVRARAHLRHGTLRPEIVPERWDAAVCPGEKVLVVGNGEYGFQPLCLAEILTAAGAETWVQATTRSPILLGGAIRHVRHFPALSGEGYTEFLYNVPDVHGYDRVILCTEDARPGPDHPIWRIPGLEIRS